LIPFFVSLQATAVTAMMSKQDDKFIKSFSESSLLKAYISNYITERSGEAISHHGSFVIALSGGSMPKLLSDLAERSEIEWDKIFVLFADERCT
jgi:6-phosphogluconolactonase